MLKLQTKSTMLLILDFFTGVLTTSPEQQIRENWMSQYQKELEEINNARIGLAKSSSSNLIQEVSDPNYLIFSSDRSPVDVQIRRTETLLKHLKTLAFL